MTILTKCTEFSTLYGNSDTLFPDTCRSNDYFFVRVSLFYRTPVLFTVTTLGMSKPRSLVRELRIRKSWVLGTDGRISPFRVRGRKRSLHQKKKCDFGNTLPWLLPTPSSYHTKILFSFHFTYDSVICGTRKKKKKFKNPLKSIIKHK